MARSHDRWKNNVLCDDSYRKPSVVAFSRTGGGMSDELEQLRSENSRLRASNKRLTEHILGPIVDVLPLLLQLPPERGGLGAEMRQRLSDAFGAENATLIVETKMGKSGVDWAKVPEVMSPDELPLFHQNLD